jgi:hypothetical protein
MPFHLNIILIFVEYKSKSKIWNFLPYNKEVLFSVIDRISITKEGDQVVTKYGNRVIKVANVSNRYEIFDIAKYLKVKLTWLRKL